MPTISKSDLIGIIGGGTMGAGIALNAIQHGFRVVLVEKMEGVQDRFAKRMDEHAMRATKKDRSAADAFVSDWSPRIQFETDASAISDSKLVIEAIFEDLDAKKALYRSLNLRKDAVLASNTSSLLVNDLATAVVDPTRFLGLHYFLPAERSPLVEIVRGRATSNDADETVRSFTSQTKRIPLTCADAPGFVVNRFLCAIFNEASKLLEEGMGSAAQIDLAAQDAFGCPAGPFCTMNLVGNKVSYEATRNLAPLGKFYAPSKALEAFGATKEPWPIATDASPLISHDTLKDRLLGALFLPMLELLRDKICTMDDIDLGAQHGPKFEKLPSHLVKAYGEARVRELAELVR